MGEAEVKVLESAGSIRLPDRHVAVVGDLHGNVDWARSLARALSLLAPDVTTMLQLGDWQMTPADTDEIFAETGIKRIFVTLGNHERWNEITPALEGHPGAAVRVSKVTWLLPRPARLTIGDRRILSLGGAASVDRASRTKGLT